MFSIKLPSFNSYNYKQLGIIIGIAVIALGLGAFVAGKFFAQKTPSAPLPTPSAAVSQNSLPDIAVAPTNTTAAPSPTVAAKAKTKVSTPAPPPVAKSAKPTTPARTNFSWGIAFRPEPFPSAQANLAILPEQFKVMKELGVSSVRVDYNPSNQALNDEIVKLAKENGLTLVLIIPFGPNDIHTDKDLAANAYKYVSDIVGRYKGQVPIWQLGTEVATVAIRKPDLHGADVVDFPDNTYKPVATWLLAATKAAKEADPQARRLVNDQWIHVGFFDKFLKEGGDFEIIGWNWFSDMGDNMENVLIDHNTGQKYELMKKLRSFGKEIWLTEINRRNGSADGNEKAQADYIETMANATYANQYISGFVVFHLMGEQGYGIVHANDTEEKIGQPKEAFSRYQDIIRAKK